MNSRVLFHLVHAEPLPPDLLTGMCQDEGPADVLDGYLKEACGCTELLAQVLPSASTYYVEPDDGCRYYVHVSDQFVVVTLGELDDDNLRGVTLHRRSKHVNVFEGTNTYTRDMCTRIAKEANHG